MSIEISAHVDSSVLVPNSSKIWHNAQIRENALVGENVVIGRGVYIGSGVIIKDKCKIQNYALIYEPAYLGKGVFIGPNVVFTNDKFPRSVTLNFDLKKAVDWKQVGIEVREGASIGAGSICIAPLTIGCWALIAAGSIVTTNVPDFALMMGSPARKVGWVGRSGKKLIKDTVDETIFICPMTKTRYKLNNSDSLTELL